ncbi:hypothetical protein [Pantoea sp. App145]|uniref:hypothetical protein n=1 Tax=Pantoea sp. App145 TaxID=3071567 RepID=UPI003A7FCDB1
MTTLSNGHHFARLQAPGAKYTLSDPLHNASRFYAVIDAVSPAHRNFSGKQIILL